MTNPVIIGDCELWLGDCLEILPKLGKVDAVVTDPPYGVGFTGKKNKDKTHIDGYACLFGDDDAFINSVVVPAVTLSLSLSERAAIFPGIGNIQTYPKSRDLGGFFVEYGGGRGPWGFNSMNPVLYYGKDPRLQDGKGGHPNSWLVADTAEKNGHPCPKPIGWMTKLVTRATRPSETVLDPFMGSGTTGVACVKLGRKFIGIEIEPKYFDIACKRIEAAYDQPDLFVAQPAKVVQEPLL